MNKETRFIKIKTDEIKSGIDKTNGYALINKASIHGIIVTDETILINFGSEQIKLTRSKHPTLLQFLLHGDEAGDEIRTLDLSEAETLPPTESAKEKLVTENISFDIDGLASTIFHAVEPCPEKPDDSYDRRLGAFIRGFREAARLTKK